MQTKRVLGATIIIISVIALLFVIGYIFPGNRDDATFTKNPLTTLPLTSGFIQLKGDLYELDQITQIPSNCHLRGVAGKTIIKSKPNISAVMLTQPVSENILIEDIIFDGSGIEQQVHKTIFGAYQTKNLTIRNCVFRNLRTWHLIELNGAQNVRIENCVFEGYTGGSEMLQIDYLGGAYQFPWGKDFDDSVCSNVVITNCVFIGEGIDYGYGIGNHTFKEGIMSKNILITKNSFYDLKGAVALYDIQDCVIMNNRATNCKFPVYKVGDRENKSINIEMKNNI